MSLEFPWPRSTTSILSSPDLKQWSHDLLWLLSRKKTQKMALWMLVSLGVTVMSAGHGKLVLATGMGMGTMWLAYQRHHWGKWSHLLLLKPYLKGYNQKLVLAVLSGGTVTLITYLGILALSESENRGLVLLSLLQTVGTSTLFGWMIWKSSKQPHYSLKPSYETLIRDLTTSESLKRLITVRSLLHLWEQGQLSELQQTHLEDYFTLMLSSETEIKIRLVLLEGLKQMKQDKIPLQPIKQRESSKIYLAE